jgi:hypothetical protein
VWERGKNRRRKNRICGPMMGKNGKEKGGEFNRGRWVAKYGDGWLSREVGG